MFKAKTRADVSKQMDEVLGKPPVPNSYMPSKEYNTKEDELLTLKAQVEAKEAELNKKEKEMRSELKELDSKLNISKKARIALLEEIDVLKQKRDKFLEENKKIQEDTKAHRKQIKYAEDAHELLQRKEKRVTEHEEKVKARDAYVTAKEKELSALNKQINEKEHVLNRLSQLILTEKEAFEKRKSVLLSNIDDLEKRKLVLGEQIREMQSEFTKEESKLKQAVNEINGLYKDAEKKHSALDRRASETNKQIDQQRLAFEGEITKKINELAQKDERLTKHALTLDKRELDLRAKAEKLQKEQDDFESIKHEEEQVRKKIIELTTEERIVEQRIGQKQGFLTNVNIDYQNKVSELETDRKLLGEKEDEFVERIKQLEHDEQTLAKKENEFISTINKLEKDKKMFDKKIDEFASQIDRLESFDKEAAEKTEALRKKEMEIARLQVDLEMKQQKVIHSQEFKLNIASLKKEKEELQKQLKQLESRSKKASEIMKKIDLREKRLNEREKMLAQKDDRLKGLLADIASERSELTSKEFGTYFEKELQTQEIEAKEEAMGVTYQLLEEEQPKNYQVLAMIADAKNALVSSNVDGAKNIYSKLNTMYKKLPANEEKKKLYYEILELKTDIELKAI